MLRMSVHLCALAALLTLSALLLRPADAQTTSTQATVLGCTNPAPAAAGKPTVFFAKCTSTAFLPVTTSSAVASVSKTAPVWAHSFTAYAGTALLVACPAGAIVSGSTCTVNGVDASALVAQSKVAAFSVAPVTSPASCPPDTWEMLNWKCSRANGIATCTAPAS